MLNLHYGCSEYKCAIRRAKYHHRKIQWGRQLCSFASFSADHGRHLNSHDNLSHSVPCNDSTRPKCDSDGNDCGRTEWRPSHDRIRAVCSWHSNLYRARFEWPSPMFINVHSRRRRTWHGKLLGRPELRALIRFLYRDGKPRS